MTYCLKIYQYANTLSLDVVAGSIICSLFFAKVFSVSVSAFSVIGLAIAVWVIYTVDHLRDAQDIAGTTSADRYAFHKRNHKILFRVLLAVSIVGVTITWFIPVAVKLAGLAIGILVAAYLLFHRHLKYFKELFIAAMFTSGVLLPSFFQVTDISMQRHILPFQFFLTALANLLLFSIFDYDRDLMQRQNSFVTSFGRSSGRKIIFLLGLINIITSIWFTPVDGMVALILLTMNVLILLILFGQKPLTENKFNRILADAIFLLPVLYFL